MREGRRVAKGLLRVEEKMRRDFALNSLASFKILVWHLKLCRSLPGEGVEVEARVETAVRLGESEGSNPIHPSWREDRLSVGSN